MVFCVIVIMAGATSAPLFNTYSGIQHTKVYGLILRTVVANLNHPSALATDRLLLEPTSLCVRVHLPPTNVLLVDVVSVWVLLLQGE